MTINQEPIDNPQEWVAEHIRRYVATYGDEGHSWYGAPALLSQRLDGEPARLAGLPLFTPRIALDTSLLLPTEGPTNIQLGISTFPQIPRYWYKSMASAFVLAHVQQLPRSAQHYGPVW